MRMYYTPKHHQLIKDNILMLNDPCEKMMVTRGLPCPGKKNGEKYS